MLVESGRSAVGAVRCRRHARGGAGGHGAVVVVVGSAGIGKSRLVREVAAIAAGGVSRCSRHSANHTPARSPSRSWRDCCVRSRDQGSGPGRSVRGYAAACGRRSRRPCATRRSAEYPGPRGGTTRYRAGCTASPIDRIGECGRARSPGAGGLGDRGRTLDRRVQRSDAGRVPHGDPADALAGADHVPSGVSRRVGARHRSGDDCPRPAE